jgi:ubiquinone/menaquinone biosynthesis C-methylase UbiE
MSVLDVGCGSRAITRGIADAVGPGGIVVGVDINEQLLAMTAAATRERQNVSFQLADATRLGYSDAFDVVTRGACPAVAGST